jgi:hypothetical protein
MSIDVLAVPQEVRPVEIALFQDIGGNRGNWSHSQVVSPFID